MTIVGRDAVLGRLARAGSGRDGLVVLLADAGAGLTAVLEAHLDAVRATGRAAHRVTAVPPRGRTALSDGLPDWSGPGVVLVDRAELVDDATLLALHQLLDERRSLTVLCGRRRGPDRPRLSRADEVVVELEPLDDAALDLLAARVPADRRPRAREAGSSPKLLALLAGADPVRAVSRWAAEVAGADIGVLRFAALLGRSTTIDELATVCGLSAPDTVAAVDRLGASGLLDEQAGLVTARYELVRRTLAETSGGLGAAVARALADAGAPVARVVAALANTPPTAWSVDWLVGQGTRLGSTEDTVDALRAALGRLSPDDRRTVPLRAALAEALLWTGDRDAAEHTARACLTLDPDPPLRHRLRAVLAQACIARMDADGALAALDAERTAGPLPDRLAAVDAYARMLAGDVDGCRRTITDLAPGAGRDPQVAVPVLHLQAAELILIRDLPAAEQRLDRAAGLLEVAAVDPAQWLLSRLLRAALQDLRHEAAALETALTARATALRLGAGWLDWWRTVAILAAYNCGRWEQALVEVDGALSAPDPSGDRYGLARPLHGIAAHILAHRGDLDAARDHLSRAEGARSRGVAVFYEQVLLSAQAMVADLAGDRARALELVRAVAGVGGYAGNAVTAAAPPLVRIAVRGGERELAAGLLAEIQRWTTDDSTGQQATLWYCRGLVDGDPELLLAAERRHAADGSPIAAGHAAEDAAVLLAAAGRPEDARAAHARAVAHYSGLAAATDIARAGAALRTHGVRPGAGGPRRRPKQGWDSLTDAERRVADLVARGKTNREIAAHLVVSVRTVDTHVSRILGKLGYTSRAAVIRDSAAAEHR